MFKLLLVSTVMAPVAFISFWNSDAPTMPETEWGTYVEPAVEKLSECQNADMSIYFHDIYITTHSAEYIFDGVRALSACQNVEFEIIPLMAETGNQKERALSLRQAGELQEYMRVAGFEAKISPLRVDSAGSPDSGRAALLRISTHAPFRS